MSSAGATLRPFREELTLSTFNSNGAGGLHCSPEFITIYLAVPGAPVIPMRVLESDSISSVKLKVQSCKGVDVKKQKLVFDGRELARNDCLIRDYGVSDGNILHLIIKSSDLRVITVKTASGKKLKFRVEQGQTVHYVKKQVAEMGISDANQDQKLVFEGEELDDRREILDICKNSNAFIHLLVRKSAEIKTGPVEKDFELSIVAPLADEPCADDTQAVPRNPSGTKLLIEPVIVNRKVELPQVIEDLLCATLSGLEKGNPPIMSTEGTGGAYFMPDISGNEHVAVFKPIDEEPLAVNNPQGLPVSTNGEGLKRGTRVGEGAFREVAAYILDHPISGPRSFSQVDFGFAGVRPTVLAQCLHPGFKHPAGCDPASMNFKIGSLQMFAKNNGSCEDMGPRAFPVQEVHKISVLDIRLANADRHAGNILFCKEGEEGRVVLVPIDHGYCLPENFEDCTFEWLYWPQSRQPFSSETIEYIKLLDAEQDIALLKFYGWDLSLECARTIRISTMLLKKGAEKGLTPYDIGNILCRETIKKKSRIEEIIQEAQDAVLPGTSEAVFLESVSVVMDRYFDGLTK
ncbi:phosphatidylinositol 4-kinase gamma 4-like [Canna indica]|uniref:1-phosphatidylinositol 4-kinase n=1 Tax=Canna indica TaxID=4628 RepID=A0AAQ3JWV9_9LILI|nr:phosphatidylinositol 4-kinase gamma 4-like [Canna indica]